MRVKMCGMRSLAAARAARDAGADYIGFIFARESRRYITPKDARSICAAVDVVKKAGVFVDTDPAEMNEIAAYCGLDYIQLHGHEPAETARRVERPVIKAYRCGDDFDADAANAYPAEIILVDSYAPGAAGGTGAAFAWEDAAREIARVTKPVLIAGGLTAENARAAIEIFHPFGLDVSGGLEENGEKSIAKIAVFMAAVRAGASESRGHD